MSESDVCVVVAATGDMSPSREGIKAFLSQAVEQGGRVVLVDATARGYLEQPGAGLSLVRGSTSALVPELWALGLKRCSSRLVVLTTSAMRPEPGWLAGLVGSIDRGGFAGVGGAILPGDHLAALDWATYLSRYAGYASPAEGLPPAGENCVYRRADLDAVQLVWSEGFWESEVNEALRTSGARFGLDRSARLRYAGGAGWGDQRSRRFRHGYRYGLTRKLGPLGRLRALAAPGVPVVLGLRAFRNVRRAGSPWGMPGLGVWRVWLALTLCWTAGEALGILRRPLPRARSRRGEIARVAVSESTLSTST